MTQMLAAPTPLRPPSRPLSPVEALRAAVAAMPAPEGPQDFEGGLNRVQSLVSRYRAVCLACQHAEAEGAIAYHDRADQELRAEFAPLYYRRAVMENVLARYERAARVMLSALA